MNSELNRVFREIVLSDTDDMVSQNWKEVALDELINVRKHPVEIMEIVRNEMWFGRKISAIKIVHLEFNLTLKEAKEFVENVFKELNDIIVINYSRD